MNRCWLAAALTAAGAVSSGCDEVVDVRNRAPAIVPLSLCQAQGSTYFLVRLTDLEEDRVDVDLVVDLGDGPRRVPSGRGGTALAA